MNPTYVTTITNRKNTKKKIINEYGNKQILQVVKITAKKKLI